MAKRTAKMKKPSDEQPALHMVIEKGRLVPAYQFDFERLDSYRNGTKVNVWMSIDGDRPLVRRWFATIGNYLKHTNLPWSDKESASAAIKLALALVVPFKTHSGQWAQYPRSVLDLDDKELEDAIRQMEQLLYEMTGVDVETLRRENRGSFGDEPFETTQPANDAGEETLAGGAVPPPASEESASAGHNPPPAGTGATDSKDNPEAAAEVAGDYLREPVAAEQGQIIREGEAPLEASNGEASDSAHPDTDSPEPASGGPAPVDETEAREEPSASSTGELSAEERIWLKQGGKMMLACLPSTDPESMRVLIGQLRVIRDLAPKDVSNACLSRMEVIRLHVTGVCKGQHNLDVALVAKTALCSVADVTPEPVKTRAS